MQGFKKGFKLFFRNYSAKERNYSAKERNMAQPECLGTHLA
jgi:hypothetical protein